MKSSTLTKHFLLVVSAFLLMTYAALAQTCAASFTSSVNVPAKTATFTNTSTGTSLNYYWNFGDGNYSSLASPTHVYANNGTYFVSLTITKSDSSCYSSVTDTIQVGSPCAANFYYTIDPNNAHTYNFHNTSTGTNPVYYWDFGDGTSSSLQNPSHTYASNGTKMVHLYINNLDSSCFDSKTIYIMVTSSCSAMADFNFSGDSSDYRKVYFSNTSVVNNPGYYWWFSDGTSTTTTSPAHTFPSAGTYMVCLWATNMLDSSCWDSTCKLVNITNPCSAAFSFYTDSMNGNPDKLFFNSSTSKPGLVYNWNFGDGYSSSLKNPVHQYSANGTYTVCLTVTDPADTFCFDQQCIQVHIGSSNCDATFSAFVDSLNRTAYFSPATFDTLNMHYTWSFGDGSTSHHPFPSHHYSSSGYYIACLTISSNDSSCWDTYCDTIYVAPTGTGCHANFRDSIFGNGFVVFINTSTTSPGPLYFWHFGDGATSNLQNPTHQYTQNGVYAVCLTIGSSIDSTCWSYFCDTIIINNIPVDTGCHAAFTYAQDSITGNIHFFNQSAPSSLLYFWNFGDGSTSSSANPVHHYTTNGWYVVCLTVTSFDSLCWDTYCDTILVSNVNTPCSADFTYYADSLNPNTIHFINLSAGSALTYIWNFGSGYSTLANPTFTFPAAGMYVVTLFIYNSTTGCSDTIVKAVTVPAGGPCQASFTMYPAGNGSVFFVSTSSGSGLSYWWDFGDGSPSSTLQNPTHTYATTGSYHVTLFVFGSNGCYDSTSMIIYVPVISGCDASFTFVPDSMSTTYYFAPIYNQPGTTYLWTFDGTDTSSSQYPQYTFPKAGYYLVCLTVTNWMDSCWATWCDTVYVSGTTALKETNGITVSNAYPVPFTDKLTLDLTSPGTASAKVIIMDIAGKIVLEKDVTLQTEQNTLSFDTRDLSKGVYFVDIMSEYGHTVKKICK
jgi:PKD repeat protein